MMKLVLAAPKAQTKIDENFIGVFLSWLVSFIFSPAKFRKNCEVSRTHKLMVSTLHFLYPIFRLMRPNLKASNDKLIKYFVVYSREFISCEILNYPCENYENCLYIRKDELLLYNSSPATCLVSQIYYPNKVKLSLIVVYSLK